MKPPGNVARLIAGVLAAALLTSCTSGQGEPKTQASSPSSQVPATAAPTSSIPALDLSMLKTFKAPAKNAQLPDGKSGTLLDYMNALFAFAKEAAYRTGVATDDFEIAYVTVANSQSGIWCGSGDIVPVTSYITYGWKVSWCAAAKVFVVFLPNIALPAADVVLDVYHVLTAVAHSRREPLTDQERDCLGALIVRGAVLTQPTLFGQLSQHFYDGLGRYGTVASRAFISGACS